MGQSSAGFFCPQCNTRRLFTCNEPNHVLHALLSLFLCGTWLVVWFLVAVQSRPYYCTVCGYSGSGQYLADPGRRARELVVAHQKPGKPRGFFQSPLFLLLALGIGVLCLMLFPLYIQWVLQPTTPAPAPSTPTPTQINRNANMNSNANTRKHNKR